jgi:hypothetical protein
MVQVVAVAADTVQVPPDGVEVTVYPVMTAPPLLGGSVQLMVTCGAEPYATPDTLVADPIVGAPGVVAGMAVAEARDAGPLPTPVEAVTVKV